MNPDLIAIVSADWSREIVFTVFLASGLILLFMIFRKAGEGARQQAARLAGLRAGQAQEETQSLTALPEFAPLYREDNHPDRWRQKLKGRVLLLLIMILICIVLLLFAIREYPFHTLIIAGGGVSLVGGYFALRHYQNKTRRKRLVEQLPEAIDIIVRGARVGMSLQENFQVIAREMPDPVGSQFRILAEKLTIGIDLEAALFSAVDEIGVKELQFMATTLILQRQTGGQYAEVLENLARVLRDRRAQYLKARALTSEARVSARIVTVVTGVVLTILALTNKAQFEFLFVDPLGHDLLIYSGVCIFIGFFAISRLLRSLQ
ncbi:hypothetical protein GQE98_14325 [Sneathiella sp. DP05]|uniref:Type II secretion system protein GspF domain-containing protein n=2 Tax=Sneathiella litorea TaxID=2606216 RepID=A0A6L8WAR8_9PROT|nr:hypothetical protein [Sneathiella litorea]